MVYFTFFNLKVTEIKTHKNIFLRVLVISSVMMLTAMSTAQAITVNINSYQGTWSSGTKYSAGNVITHNNQTFLSLVGSNQGKTPGTSGTANYWQLLGSNVPGPQGPQGPAGAQGPQGIQGLTGAALDKQAHKVRQGQRVRQAHKVQLARQERLALQAQQAPQAQEGLLIPTPAESMAQTLARLVR